MTAESVHETANPAEDRLRDDLANNLDLLEPGLLLVGIEYRLPNEAGTSGRIDILARDRFGLFVVIEIKRSNSVARAALHELHKYAELLRTERGLAPGSIRCVILSTEWAELIRPFSSLVRSFEYPVWGGLLTTNSSGKIISIERVQPLPTPSSSAISGEHRMYLFDDEGTRDAAFRELSEALSDVGAPDIVGLSLDPSPEMRATGYSFLLYAALGTVEPERFLDEIESDEEADYRGPWPVESLVFELAQRRLKSGLGAEEFQLASSSSFDSLVAEGSGWNLGRVHRAGVFALQASVVSDDEILRSMSGRTGASDNLVELRSSPELPQSWKMMRETIDRVLAHADDWRNAMAPWLEIAESANVSEVYFAAFAPYDLVQSLVKNQDSGGTNGPPWLNAAAYLLPQLGVSGSVPTRRLQGELVWNGVIGPSLEDAFKEIYGSSFQWAMYHNPVSDGQLLELLGLKYGLFERDHKNEVWLLELHNGALNRRRHDDVVFSDKATLIWHGSLPFERFLSERSAEIPGLIQFATRDRIAQIY